MDLIKLELEFKNKKNFKKIFYSNEVFKKEFQRLEFLGDRVLAIVLASELYKRYPELNEGKLATIFSFLTSSMTISKIAYKIKLDLFLKKNSCIQISNKVLSDYLEAILGSLYVDSGIEKVRGLVVDLWGNELVDSKKLKKDAKSILQEWTQAKGLGLPTYKIKEKQGLDHDPLFEIELIVKNYKIITGKGKSLQSAQKKTAEEFIKKFLDNNVIAK